MKAWFYHFVKKSMDDVVHILDRDVSLLCQESKEGMIVQCGHVFESELCGVCARQVLLDGEARKNIMERVIAGSPQDYTTSQAYVTVVQASSRIILTQRVV